MLPLADAWRCLHVHKYISGGLGAATGDMGCADMCRSTPFHAQSAQAEHHAIADVPCRELWLDGLRHAIPTGHSVILCFMFGPLGMLSHMVTRAIRRRPEQSSVVDTP